MDVPPADEEEGLPDQQPQQQPAEGPPTQEMTDAQQQQQHLPTPGAAPGTIAAAKLAAAADVNRTRSPTPPRALFRSTTGKGVAFTDEDVMFLVRFFEYRSRTMGGKVDMVTFWKDVAAKVSPSLEQGR